MSDTRLSIDVDISQAEAAVKKFSSIIKQTGDDSTALAQKLATVTSPVDRLNDAMSKLSSTSALSNATSSAAQLSTAMQSIQSGNITDAISSFQLLGSAASSIMVGLTTVGSALLNIGKNVAAISLGGLLSGMSALGSAAMDVAGKIGSMLTRLGAAAVVGVLAAGAWKLGESFLEAAKQANALAAATGPTLNQIKEAQPEFAKTVEKVMDLAKAYGLGEEALKKLQNAMISGAPQGTTNLTEKSVTELEKLRAKLIETRDANLMQLRGMNELMLGNKNLTDAEKVRARSLSDAVAEQSKMIQLMSLDMSYKKQLLNSSTQAANANRQLATSTQEVGKAFDGGNMKVADYLRSLQGIQAARGPLDILSDGFKNASDKLSELLQKFTGIGVGAQKVAADTGMTSESFRQLLNNSDALAKALANVDATTRNAIESRKAEAEALRGAATDNMARAQALTTERNALGENTNALQARLATLTENITLEKGAINANAERLAAMMAERDAINATLSATFEKQNAMTAEIQKLNELANAQRAQAGLAEAEAIRMLKYKDALTAINTEADKLSVSSTTSAAKMTELGNGMERVRESTAGVSGATGEFASATRASADAQGVLQSSIASTAERIAALTAEYRRAIDAATEFNRVAAGRTGGGPNTSPPDVSLPAQREGGYAGDMMQTAMAPMDVFKSAPHFAQGTANTNSVPSMLAGGGKPAVLHPNEAVVPLSKGRTIPVEISGPANDTAGTVAQLMRPLAASVSELANATSRLSSMPQAEVRAPVMLGMDRLIYAVERMSGERTRTVDGAVTTENSKTSVDNSRRVQNVVINVKDASFGTGLTRDQTLYKLQKEILKTIRQNG